MSLKKVAVINEPNLVQIISSAESRLSMLPLVFSSDREIMGKEMKVSNGVEDLGTVLVNDIEELVKYVEVVRVNLNSEEPMNLKDLVVRPSIIVMDKNLASLFGVVINRGSLCYLSINDLKRD